MQPCQHLVSRVRAHWSTWVAARWAGVWLMETGDKEVWAGRSGRSRGPFLLAGGCFGRQCLSQLEKLWLKRRGGARGAQSVEHPDFGSGHDLTAHEFEPRVGPCADSSEPGACFRVCVSLSLCPSPAHALSLSLSKVNKYFKKLKK